MLCAFPAHQFFAHDLHQSVLFFFGIFRGAFSACAPDWPLQNQKSKAYYTKPVNTI
jgi:hypothetical protein